MGNLIRTTSNSQVINNAQAHVDQLSLLNLNNLPQPLQLLAKARYFLSVIHDEILHTTTDNIFDRGKVGQFAANLHAELEQVPLALLGYDDDLRELAESLTRMAKQLYHSLYYNNELSTNYFKEIAKQSLDIHECLEQSIHDFSEVK